MEKLQKTFEDSKQNTLGGNIKFSTDYISYFELFKAVSKWVETDKNVLTATIRSGGGSQIVLDFQYDVSKLSAKDVDTSLHTVLKPKFQELLGGDYMIGWDYSTSVYKVK